MHQGGSAEKPATFLDDAADFRFDDDSGVLDWVGPDRGVVTFRDLDDVAARQAAVVHVVNRWVVF